ncbi:M48 family metalloprotease [Candidatus Sororendozoicomonas aggregata]|uniref:M48 family metalloprotease n=1 Tax=Candidatus Sororendozoicomonas aggregata TaxID=3073239 RepID=UPI002ECFC443
MKYTDFLPALLLSGMLATMPVRGTEAVSANLPSLGDATSGIISPQQEYELGRRYLKVIRGQTPTESDAELKDYLERLVSRLSAASELKDHRLTTLIIKDTRINAFAAPGGIIGVNTGLFLNANSEAQFAAVLAHELAHLSQRHYARNVENAKNNSLPTAAAILGSIILIAAGGAEAGAAGITSTMAGLMSSQLGFSRQLEREADNLGMVTLVRAGFDPRAMSDVFEQMGKAHRFSSRPPEFLSTHPVTENRISDSRARADQMRAKGGTDSESYQLMRMRAVVLSTDNPHALLNELTKELATRHSGNPDITRYGIALLATQTNQIKQAETALEPLLKSNPDNLYYLIAKANLDAAAGNTAVAIKNINKALEVYIDYYPLMVTKATLLTQQKNYKASRDIWLALSDRRQDDPDIWYELAEAQGQAGDILGLHQARAEYFFLTGNIDDAIKHIQYAQKMVKNNFALKTALDKKLKDMYDYRKNMSN